MKAPGVLAGLNKFPLDRLVGSHFLPKGAFCKLNWSCRRVVRNVNELSALLECSRFERACKPEKCRKVGGSTYCLKQLLMPLFLAKLRRSYISARSADIKVQKRSATRSMRYKRRQRRRRRGEPKECVIDVTRKELSSWCNFSPDALIKTALAMIIKN